MNRPRARSNYPASLPGLTRQSIFLRRRWTRGSSPRVTAEVWINVITTCSDLSLLAFPHAAPGAEEWAE